MITYYRVKGQLARREEWRLTGDFKGLKEYECRYYSLQHRHDGWYLVAYIGCSWDFATKFPDFKWVKEPSLWHDIMHWLIAQGCISEDQNDLIDHEMAEVIKARSKFKAIGKARAFYIEKAINTVDQKQGEKRKVYYA